jgi:16S rRNA (guanine(527)-N(7))-methyltransferase RsmG
LDDKYPSLSEASREGLLQYGTLLGEAADRMGLVARGDRPRLFRRHLVESLAPALVAALPGGARILDVGAGGGLPGIPLAIVRPDVRVTLLEAREKKISFLERTLLLLGVTNATVWAGSMEGLIPRPGPWDVAISRGVAWRRPMVAALEACLGTEGVLIRFGAPGPLPEPVRIQIIEVGSPRVLQFWPRSAWKDLPKAP